MSRQFATSEALRPWAPLSQDEALAERVLQARLAARSAHGVPFQREAQPIDEEQAGRELRLRDGGQALHEPRSAYPTQRAHEQP